MKKKILGIVGALEIELLESGQVCILDLSGEIDTFTAEEVTKMLEAYLNKGNFKIIIDLEKVGYLDSAGLTSLINAKIKLSKRKGDLCLVGLKGKAKEVFELAGVLELFSVYDKRGKALEYLSNL